MCTVQFDSFESYSFSQFDRPVWYYWAIYFHSLRRSTLFHAVRKTVILVQNLRSFWERVILENGSYGFGKGHFGTYPANSSCSKLKKKCVFRHFQCDDFQFLVTLVKNFSSHWQTVGFANVTTNFSQCDDDKNLSSDWKHHLNLSSHWHSKCMNLECLKKICRHIGR